MPSNLTSDWKMQSIGGRQDVRATVQFGNQSGSAVNKAHIMTFKALSCSENNTNFSSKV